MSKKLAIQGHPTHNKEVVELMRILGGKNSNGYKCSNPNRFYHVLNEHICWGYIGLEEIDKYEIFTLEEFWEKYPFKVGDKVTDGYGDTLTIKSMAWFEDCETMVYTFEDSVIVLAAKDLKMWNGEPDAGLSLKIENINMNIEFDLTKYSYEVMDGKLVVSEKKLVYPKTYAECCRVLGIYDGVFIFTGLSNDEFNLFDSFVMLKRCRDAYWKIADDWSPNWNEETDKFTISNKCNDIYLNNTAWYSEFLAFPTAEMRDAFYENFKDLIESCKELL